jgi:hypothetical protein
MKAVAALALAMLATTAHADDAPSCRVIDVKLTPADQLQIVAWIEDPAGNFVGTAFITQQTGTYGMGNRPGELELNSGPNWPYGRRETTFPIWSHRHGLTWPMIEFQATVAGANAENDVSQPAVNSSAEPHYCRPIEDSGTDKPYWDAQTCPTARVDTDKGAFSLQTSLYPPRADVTRDATMEPDDDGVLKAIDSADVAMYAAMNPFDAVSKATPVGGVATSFTWAAPSTVPAGSYVLWVEVSQEYDFNASYDATVYPSPQVPYGMYGVPYRGQPSVVYTVPFTINASGQTSATTASYAGYGDPTGQDGLVNPPDSTISTDVPSSGASRLQLVADELGMWRVRVDSSTEDDTTPPAMPADGSAVDLTAGGATIEFVAPGDDGDTGTVSGYDLRVRANDPITDANFDSSMPVAATVTPDAAGSLDTFTLTGLLPSTSYDVGIRAYDNCGNTGPLAVIPFTTADRTGGDVDACFIATAAYGSLLANDVVTLRSFRDRALRTTLLGELAVEAYYTFGPSVAGVIGQSELLRATTRAALAPVVAAVRGRGR